MGDKLQTTYQWVNYANKTKLKIGLIQMGVAGLTQADSQNSVEWETLNKWDQISSGDKIYLSNSGATDRTTLWGANSCNIGTPLLNTCKNPVTMGISEESTLAVFSIDTTQSDTSTIWLKCAIGGDGGINMDTGVPYSQYKAGNVIYIWFVCANISDGSTVKTMCQVNGYPDYGQKAGSGNKMNVPVYIFGADVPGTLQTFLKAFTYESDASGSQTTIPTSDQPVMFTTTGNFKILHLNTRFPINTNKFYDVDDIQYIDSSMIWTMARDPTLETGYGPPYDDLITGYDTAGSYGTDRRQRCWNNYALYYFNNSMLEWSAEGHGSNILAGKDEEGKYINGLTDYSFKTQTDVTIELRNGTITWHGGWGLNASYITISNKAGKVIQKIKLNYFTTLDPLDSTQHSGWQTSGLFIAKYGNDYKLIVVGQIGGTYSCTCCGINLNSDSVTLIADNETVETKEYTTPQEEINADTEKTRKGEDENGTYTEYYDPETGEWTRVYDDERTKDGTRGHSDGTSQIAKDDTKIDEPRTNTNITATGGFYRVFTPSMLELKTFANELHDESVLNKIKEYFTNNPMDGLMGFGMIPYYHNPDGTEYPTIGTWQSGQLMSYTSSDTIIFNYGSLQVQEAYGNYLDYKGTTMSIFLPHIGYKDIDPQLVMGCTITLKYIIYMATGDIVAYMYSNNHLIYQWAGNCIMLIPVTHTDHTNAVASAINVASKMAGVMAGTVGETGSTSFSGDMGLSALNSVAGMNKPQLLTAGNISGTAGFYTARQAYLIISRPMVVTENTNQYAHDYGLPSAEQATIRSCKGFTKFANIEVSGIPCTDDERQEIKNILTGGGIYV